MLGKRQPGQNRKRHNPASKLRQRENSRNNRLSKPYPSSNQLSSNHPSSNQLSSRRLNNRSHFASITCPGTRPKIDVLGPLPVKCDR